MKLNPETIAGATSRHPWRTLGVWLVVIVMMGWLSAALLGDVLSDDVAFTNNPESARALEAVEANFGGAQTFTEFVVVSSERTWDEGYASFVQELKAAVEALGPGVVAAPVTSYGDADAMQQMLFTPDGHGVLVVLQIGDDPAGAISRLQTPVARAVPVGFEATILTPEQLAELSGGADSSSAQADPPEAFVLITHDTALTDNLQFLLATRDVEAVVTRRGAGDLTAPPYSGFDAMQQATTLISRDQHTTLLAVPIVDQSRRPCSSTT
jgi:hypothetical protein